MTIVPDGNDRAALRRHFLHLRRAMAPEEWQARNAQLLHHLGRWWARWRSAQEPRGDDHPCWVGLYWPMKGEPDVRPLFTSWRWRALPAAVASHSPLHFRPWIEGAAMIEDLYGIPTPECAATVRPEVVIVPLVAFDERGFRLGYGGGFYDRTIAAWRDEGWRGVAVGVGFSFARVADLKPQPHDVPMTVVVSDAGCLLDRTTLDASQ